MTKPKAASLVCICCWGLGIYIIFIASVTLWTSSSSHNVQKHGPLPRPQQPRADSDLWVITTSLYYEGVAYVDGLPIKYRIHPSRLLPVNVTLLSNDNIVAGVLSSPLNKERRDKIRQTWASQYLGNLSSFNLQDQASAVLFLVGGSWLDISQEFAGLQDLVWIDFQDDYLTVTWKVTVFLQVAAQHFPYHYALKLDDDSKAKMDKIEQRLLEPPSIHYWGECSRNGQVVRKNSSKIGTPLPLYPENKYPVYAQGAGYLLSPQSVQCMARVSQIVPALKIEDVNSGILARTCRVTCTAEHRVSHRNTPNPYKYIVHHIYQTTTTIGGNLPDGKKNNNKVARKTGMQIMKPRVTRIGIKNKVQ